MPSEPGSAPTSAGIGSPATSSACPTASSTAACPPADGPRLAGAYLEGRLDPALLRGRSAWPAPAQVAERGAACSPRHRRSRGRVTRQRRSRCGSRDRRPRHPDGTQHRVELSGRAARTTSSDQLPRRRGGGAASLARGRRALTRTTGLRAKQPVPPAHSPAPRVYERRRRTSDAIHPHHGSNRGGALDVQPFLPP